MKGYRTLRGSCFISHARNLRVPYRFGIEPGIRVRFNGFRLVIRRKS